MQDPGGELGPYSGTSKDSPGLYNKENILFW